MSLKSDRLRSRTQKSGTEESFLNTVNKPALYTTRIHAEISAVTLTSDSNNLHFESQKTSVWDTVRYGSLWELVGHKDQSEPKPNRFNSVQSFPLCF